MRPERKYVLTRVKRGDYLLPSNDGQTIWRIATYTDGPSNGLDIPKDREFWGIWKWTGHGLAVDVEDWDQWEMHGSTCETRREAIDGALMMS